MKRIRLLPVLVLGGFWAAGQPLAGQELPRKNPAEGNPERTVRAKPQQNDKGPALKLTKRKILVPVSSDGKDKLAGTWVLKNEVLGKSVGSLLQRSASKDSSFKLGATKGAYRIEIDPAQKTITVQWADWQMEGVSSSKRTGDSKIGVRVTGREEYRLTNLTGGDNPGQRRIYVKREKNTTKVKTTFRGFETKMPIELPALGSGLWTVFKNQLFLQARGEVWIFDRPDAPPVTPDPAPDSPPPAPPAGVTPEPGA